MVNGQYGAGAVMRHLQRLFSVGTVSGLTESQLLERFVSRRDEAAFEALVARHGPMVLGVCRQVLSDPNDVEDAFQATFLVLVRKAATLRRSDLLGHWLYGVAYRVAVRSRANAARRFVRERSGAEEEAVDGAHDCTPDDVGPLLHEELSRLPEKYRAPVVMCYLEGQTHEEAASALRWPVGTVKGRLSRARDLLRSRLTRRGVALSAAVLTADLARVASAAVPPALLDSTVRSAMLVAAGQVAAAGAISASVAALSEGMLRTMFVSKLKLGGAVLLVAGAAATGAWAYQTAGDGSGRGAGPGGAAAAAGGSPTAVGFNAVAAEQLGGAGGMAAGGAIDGGDAVAQALRRVGTAREAMKTVEAEVAAGRLGPNDQGRLALWSRRLAEAESDSSLNQRGQMIALQEHVERMKGYEQWAKEMFAAGHLSKLDVLDAEFRREEAEDLLAQAQAQAPAKAGGQAMLGRVGIMMAGGAPAGMSGGGMSSGKSPVTGHGGLAGSGAVLGGAFYGGGGGGPGGAGQPAGVGIPGGAGVDAAGPQPGAGGGGGFEAAPQGGVEVGVGGGISEAGPQAGGLGAGGGIGAGGPQMGGGGGGGVGMGPMGGRFGGGRGMGAGQPGGGFGGGRGMGAGQPGGGFGGGRGMGAGQPGGGFGGGGGPSGNRRLDGRRPNFGPQARSVSLEAAARDDINKRILAWLERPILLSFDGKPLSDVVKYLKATEKDSTGAGIPIYVDTLTLRDENDDQGNEPTVSIELDGVPLKTSLRLLVRQIGCVYLVKDGVLIITTPDSDLIKDEDLEPAPGQ